VAQLSKATGDGRLTLEEFADAAGAAYAAVTLAELDSLYRSFGLVESLPPPPPPPAPGAAPTAGVGAGAGVGVSVGRGAQSPNGQTATATQQIPPVPNPAPADRSSESVVAIMSGNDRKGRWRVRRRTRAVAFWGSVHLDLRDAVIESDVVEIDACAVMGGVKVTVPEGIPVELTGCVIMGGSKCRTSNVEPLPGAPVVRVRAAGMWGGVDVRSRPSRKADGRGRPSTGTEAIESAAAIATAAIAGATATATAAIDGTADVVDRSLGEGYGYGRRGWATPPPAPPPAPSTGATPPAPPSPPVPTVGGVVGEAGRTEDLAETDADAGGRRSHHDGDHVLHRDRGPGDRKGDRDRSRSRDRDRGRRRDRDRDRSGGRPSRDRSQDRRAGDPAVAPARSGDLLTVVCTDIVGSTRLAVSLGDQRWHALLSAHNAMVRDLLARYDGTEVKTSGDGFLLTFTSARAALQFSMALQETLAALRSPAAKSGDGASSSSSSSSGSASAGSASVPGAVSGDGSVDRSDPHAASAWPLGADGNGASDSVGIIELRIGVHAGEVERDGNDVIGRNVTIACRLCDAAAPGEVLASGVVAELADSASDLTFGAAREHTLAGIDQPLVAKPASRV